MSGSKRLTIINAAVIGIIIITAPKIRLPKKFPNDAVIISMKNRIENKFSFGKK